MEIIASWIISIVKLQFETVTKILFPSSLGSMSDHQLCSSLVNRLAVGFLLLSQRILETCHLGKHTRKCYLVFRLQKNNIVNHMFIVIPHYVYPCKI